jgi:hypothetical protein
MQLLIILMFFMLSCTGMKKSSPAVSKYCKTVMILSDSTKFYSTIKSPRELYNTIWYLNKKASLDLNMGTHPGGREYPRVTFTKSLYLLDLLRFSAFYNCDCDIKSKLRIGNFDTYELQLIKQWNFSAVYVDTSIIWK